MYAFNATSPKLADLLVPTIENTPSFSSISLSKASKKFPIRVREVRTDNGHEVQAKFHWHIVDLGIRHAYIKRGTPQLNGKVERSLRSDQQEFYQLLSYKGDVDLAAKLNEWELFYNFARPQGAHNGQIPFEALRDKLQ